MKKLLAMLLALGLLALCACTSKSNTTAEVPETTTETPSEETEQTDSAEDADAAEGTDETAAEPDDRVKPLPDAIDVTALTDASVAASFDESAIEETDGKTYLTLQVYDYDRYDMVDISNLADGSVIVAGGKDMTVSSVERDGSLVLINGGLTKGGMTLTTQDDGVYYELGVNDVKCYQEKGEVKLPLSARPMARRNFPSWFPAVLPRTIRSSRLKTAKSQPSHAPLCRNQLLFKKVSVSSPYGSPLPRSGSALDGSGDFLRPENPPTHPREPSRF